MTVDANLIEGFKLGVMTCAVIALVGFVLAVVMAYLWGREDKKAEERYERDQNIRARPSRI